MLLNPGSFTVVVAAVGYCVVVAAVGYCVVVAAVGYFVVIFEVVYVFFFLKEDSKIVITLGLPYTYF